MEKRELVIIGAGPAGLTAAIYGRRSGLDVLILEKGLPGGQINTTDEIENWPGVQHASGQELAETFREHAEKFKPEFRETEVQGIEFKEGKKIVVTDKGSIEASAILLAMGASFRKQGCPGEAEFTGRGVSYCAVCDGAFFEEQEVAVIGGGNTAVEEGVYLTQFASKVFIIHRRDSFRADKIAVERALANPKVQPIWDTVVEEICGTDMVESLSLKNVKTGELTELPVSGVFVFIGNEPNVGFLKPVIDSGTLKTAKGGWIKVNERMETSIEGVFAAGDLIEKYLRQVVTAAGDGATAAMAAYAYISEQVHLEGKLLEPEEVTAVFYSSVDEAQVRMAGELETGDQWKGTVLVDAYKNSRMAEKLQVLSLPCALKIRKGTVVKRLDISSAAELQGL
jgi:thioredoxin reductase (NADPH)